jgi:hypothetical protein
LLQLGVIGDNVPLTDAVAAVELSFFNFRKNENRKIKSQTTENQRLRLSAVIAGFADDRRAG